MYGALGLFDDGAAGPGLSGADIEDLERLKNVSVSAYEAANLAAMNCKAGVDIGLYARKVLDAAASAGTGGKASSSFTVSAREAADRAAMDRGDPLVESVLAASYKTGWEIHRIMGFLRFVPVEVPAGEKTEGGCRAGTFYFARCAPDHFILPAMAEHFEKRFGEIPWAVLDEKRNLMLIRRPGRAPSLETPDGEDGKFLRLMEESGKDDGIEDLWRLYHKSVVIENRKNLKLQGQFVPLRYRKYLAEFKP